MAQVTQAAVSVIELDGRVFTLAEAKAEIEALLGDVQVLEQFLDDPENVKRVDEYRDKIKKLVTQIIKSS